MKTDIKYKFAQINTSLRASYSERSNLKYRDCFGTSCLAMTLVWIMILVHSAYCLEVSPNRIEITVPASKSYKDILTVGNKEKAELMVSLRIEGREKDADLSWLKIEPARFDLKEGEIKQVDYRVNVPKGAKGELNAMIFVEGKPIEVKEGAITINTSIGVPIYAMIKGTEIFKAEIEGLEVINANPLVLGVKIKNSGNVHIRPTGTIDIKEKRGGKKGLSVALNEYNYPVLPNSSRTLEIRTKGQLEAGEYTAEIKMGFADKKYRKRVLLKVE